VLRGRGFFSCRKEGFLTSGKRGGGGERVSLQEKGANSSADKGRTRGRRLPFI